MSTPTFAWLGSKRSRKHDVAPKGRLLDIAARRGLPVPNGAILLDELYRLLLDEGVIHRSEESVTVPSPDWLYETIYESVRLPQLERPCAVRPVFSTSAAARLWVDVSRPAPLAGALSAVWSAALPLPDETRRDVLIMEMIAAKTSGVARLEDAYQDDLVTFTAAPEEDEPAQSLALPRLEPGERPFPSLPSFARRLQQLLRGVRRTFGGGARRVTWADDGQICWLLGVRPLSDVPPRNDAFAAVLTGSILPDPPPPLATGAVVAAAEILNYPARFDAALAGERPLLEVFAARPFLNLTRLADAARAWGLPPALLDAVGKAATRQESGFRFRRMLRRRRPLLKFGWAQARAISRARRTAAAMQRRAAETGETWRDLIDALIWMFVQIGRETFHLAAARRLSRFLLRRGGPLAPLARRRRRRLQGAARAWEEAAGAGYRRLRGEIEERAETAVAQGQLPHAGAIWLLHPEEARALDDGAVYDAAFIARREEAWEKAKRDALPRLIHRFDELAPDRE